MSFMAWRINKYLLESSSIPVGRSMFRRPRNFHDAGRSNQSCMGNIPHYKASSVSLTQLSPFRWYNRHTLQLDDVEYIIKILIHYTQHHLDDSTYYHTPIFTQPHYFLLHTNVHGEHKKRSSCHHFDSCVSHRMAWIFLFCRQGYRITGKGLKTWNRATNISTIKYFTIAPMFT